MSTFVLALALTAVGGVNPRFGLLRKGAGTYLAGWLKRVAVFVLPVWWIVWANPPALVGPFASVHWHVLGLFGVNLALTAMAAQAASRKDREPVGATGFLLAFAALVAVGGVAAWGSPMFQAAPLHRMIGQVEETGWEGNLPRADPAHIRMVTPRMAQDKAQKVLGDHGASFHIGALRIQKVQGRLQFVGDLAFRGFWRWWGLREAPGVVVVDAEDASLPARFVTGNPVRYSPSACFGNNLRRHLWTHGYHDVRLDEPALEMDDDGRARWVVPVLHPTIAWGAPEVRGVVVVDPASGAHEFFPAASVPAWIDRVIPEPVAQERIDWWGEYSQGFTHRHGILGLGFGTTMSGLFETTEYDLWLTWDEAGGVAWFTGITPVSPDDSLTGIVLLDSRTGKARRFRLPGAPQNEQSVVRRARNMVSNFEGWDPDGAILYDVNGIPTWVSPVVARGEFQTLALLHFEKDVKAHGRDKLSAIRNYRQALVAVNDPSTGARIETIEATITVTAIGMDVREGQAVFVLYDAANAAQKFTASSKISIELPLTRPGHRALVRYTRTAGENEIALASFDNLDL